MFINVVVTDSYGFVQATCDVVDWFASQKKWRDLDSKHIIEVNSDKRSIIISHRKRPEAREHVKYELRCIETLESNNTAKYVKMVSFTSHVW